jgi:hypothetical protein
MHWKHNKILSDLLGLISLLLLALISLAKLIHLFTADLGRHLTNGRLLWENLDWEILTKNTYSYTHPEFAVPMHHWASGIIFYLVGQSGGFVSLSLFYILLLLFSCACVWLITRLNAAPLISISVALLFLPLLAFRAEVRPEGFSYLFTAIVYALLESAKQQRLPHKALWILPLLLVAWVNLHIQFVFGFALLAAYWLTKKISNLNQVIIVSLVGVCTLNPFGPNGLIYPLALFKNYGYEIFENQTVWFFLTRDFDIPVLPAAITAIILTTLCVGYSLYKRRWQDPKLWLALLATIMALTAVRQLPYIFLLATPLVAQALSTLIVSYKQKIILFIACAITALYFLLQIHPLKSSWGLGVEPKQFNAARFYLQYQLKGPIFNNYDIGGYLIYTLFPEHKVFTDNRPEAYPAEFFTQTYIPMQESEKIWQQELAKYNFETIFFYRNDLTPWAQQFLNNRIRDPNWATVFLDSDVIILIQNNPTNLPLIEQFQIHIKN